MLVTVAVNADGVESNCCDEHCRNGCGKCNGSGMLVV